MSPLLSRHRGGTRTYVMNPEGIVVEHAQIGANSAQARGRILEPSKLRECR